MEGEIGGEQHEDDPYNGDD